ncbi:MAG: hypothetical protein WAN92_00545 [Herbaspirillum sp.]
MQTYFKEAHSGIAAKGHSCDAGLPGIGSQADVVTAIESRCLKLLDHDDTSSLVEQKEKMPLTR